MLQTITISLTVLCQLTILHGIAQQHSQAVCVVDFHLLDQSSSSQALRRRQSKCKAVDRFASFDIRAAVMFLVLPICSSHKCRQHRPCTNDVNSLQPSSWERCVTAAFLLCLSCLHLWEEQPGMTRITVSAVPQLDCCSVTSIVKSALREEFLAC